MADLTKKIKQGFFLKIKNLKQKKLSERDQWVEI